MNENGTLQKLAFAVAKCLELLHWIGAAVMAALFVCGLAARETLVRLVVGAGVPLDPVVATYGFGIRVTDAAGNLSVPALLLFFAASVVMLSLMAMVFRNIGLTLKTLSGTNPHTRRTTPFQPDVVRMLREIGIFFLSVSAAALVFSTAARLMLGPEMAELSVDLDSLIMGLFVLCLTGVFSYGMELQSDVDGLV